MTKLKPCPCGERSTKLHITDTLSGKWILVTADCCGEWTIEGRNNYAKGDDRYENAVNAWNSAPRADHVEDVVSILKNIDERDCSEETWDIITCSIETLEEIL